MATTMELITSAIEAERKATAARCVEIAVNLQPDRFGKLERYQCADAIKAEFELEEV